MHLIFSSVGFRLLFSNLIVMFYLIFLILFVLSLQFLHSLNFTNLFSFSLAIISFSVDILPLTLWSLFRYVILVFSIALVTQNEIFLRSDLFVKVLVSSNSCSLKKYYFNFDDICVPRYHTVSFFVGF